MKPLLSVADLGCPADALPDLQGWHSNAQTFADLIADVKPEVIVEVGSWKGASAIHMASLTDHPAATKQDRERTDFIRRDPAIIYCIDTFLGGIDHIQNEDTPPNGLNRRHGYPQIFFTFLKNVTDSGHAKRIYPIAQSSINGARLLHAHSVCADLIYVDADHTVQGCYGDIEAYWPLLRSGGIMFGDDVNFDGVRCAVTRFALERGLPATIEENVFWVIRKP